MRLWVGCMGSGYGTVMDCCKHGNEASGDKRGLQLLQKGSTALLVITIPFVLFTIPNLLLVYQTLCQKQLVYQTLCQEQLVYQTQCQKQRLQKYCPTQDKHVGYKINRE
jgi:hypothetical protein